MNFHLQNPVMNTTTENRYQYNGKELEKDPPRLPLACRSTPGQRDTNHFSNHQSLICTELVEVSVFDIPNKTFSRLSCLDDYGVPDHAYCSG